MTAWLLTWLWQGVALAAGVAVALRCLARLNAATKHLIWCGALVTLAGLAWATAPYRDLAPIPVPQADPIYIPSAPDAFIAIVLGIWAAIALVNLLRLLPGLHTVYALRDRCRPFPPSVEARLPLWLEARARGRRTELLICDALPGAAVLGLQRPCIAIPSSLLEALTIDELDQVILHEHAHVQRRDDWSRLAETLLLAVLWIHPAAFFVSRALNREREMACDEWVVARTGLPKAYARCLAHAAEVRGRLRGGSVLVSTFVDRRHELVRRVDRLLAIKNARRHASLAAATVAAFAMAAMSVQVQGVRFAEIAEIVFPHAPRPVMTAYNGATIALAEMPATVRLKAPTVRLKPDTTYDARVAPIASNARIAPNAPVAPNAPIAPSLFARTFDGTYSWPAAAVASTVAPTSQTATVDKPHAPNTWRALATPGLEVAAAAKKTSVGVASAFSRAGVSLARSF